ncbi:hypothetical protein Gobs01_03642 [Geodermatophilus obscurus DSM 43160]|uniref:Uncharacterized protein n=1 Tax=Geodermatophilus obscurus (strain ATCC 25078 / DSM 43160 / JCM 3152 / CCUG 61914 / KCC A-0152 / KCTC 9177 / NBRC 13315 / NRRL B-3577 / G-20) TaxID=526225 RepID=D2SAL3_GEOOG|nr:hypothetical protein Gobs_1192 [Geodermatophilus obscurus DSM 43160]
MPGKWRLRVWRIPVAVLTRAQRKQLVAQVRGWRPVDPDRLPLARLAEQLVAQRNGMLANMASRWPLWGCGSRPTRRGGR